VGAEVIESRPKSAALTSIAATKFNGPLIANRIIDSAA
jgi:hypothetical protein